MGSVSGSLITLNLLFSPPAVDRNSGFHSLPNLFSDLDRCALCTSSYEITAVRALRCFGTELRRLRQAADPHHLQAARGPLLLARRDVSKFREFLRRGRDKRAVRPLQRRSCWHCTPHAPRRRIACSDSNSRLLERPSVLVWRLARALPDVRGLCRPSLSKFFQATRAHIRGWIEMAKRMALTGRP